MPLSNGPVSRPLISVFMSARNAAPFLEMSVNSILRQSLGDFEFLIIDDGSDDGTWEILNSFHDQRLRLQRNETPLGQSPNYNRLIQQAGGVYLAKMDADDISLPERFRIQVDYLEKRRDIWACSGDFLILLGEETYYPGAILREPDEIRAAFLFRNCLGHPFVMLRGEIWRKFGILYNPKVRYAQDYELWLRLLTQYPEAAFANVPERIGLYRRHAGAASVRRLGEQNSSVLRAQGEVFKKLGLSALDPARQYHSVLTGKGPLNSKEDLAGVFAWAQKLMRANNARALFSPALFNRYLVDTLAGLVNGDPNHAELFARLMEENSIEKI